jgi:hypothetical protein
LPTTPRPRWIPIRAIALAKQQPHHEKRRHGRRIPGGLIWPTLIDEWILGKAVQGKMIKSKLIKIGRETPALE